MQFAAERIYFFSYLNTPYLFFVVEILRFGLLRSLRGGCIMRASFRLYVLKERVQGSVEWCFPCFFIVPQGNVYDFVGISCRFTEWFLSLLHWFTKLCEMIKNFTFKWISHGVLIFLVLLFICCFQSKTKETLKVSKIPLILKLWIS